MLYFQLIAVVAVFAAIAWLATGRGGQVGEAYPDRPDVALPDDRQLRKDDVDAARFTVGWRGYRMDEVDAVLDRLANELEYRDRLIAELLPPGGMAALGMSEYASDLDFQPPSRAVAGVLPTTQTGAGTVGAAGTTAAPAEQAEYGTQAGQPGQPGHAGQSGTGPATQGEYGQSFGDFQGFGETVYGTDAASAPTEAVQAESPFGTYSDYPTPEITQQPVGATGDEADQDGPDDENPLSRWYRKPQ